MRAERARELCARGAPHFMRAAWWVGVHIVSVCFHLSWSLRGQVGHTVSCRLPALASVRRRGGGALRAGQDAAGGRAEGVPRSKCVLLEILHPHVQEQAAESLRLARYGPAKMGGPRGEGTNKVRDEKQPQRAGQEPCLCVPNIVHCGTQNRPWASAARAEVFFCYNSFSGLSIGLGGYLST